MERRGKEQMLTIDRYSLWAEKQAYRVPCQGWTRDPPVKLVWAFSGPSDWRLFESVEC